jgi:hypothetical protein
MKSPIRKDDELESGGRVTSGSLYTEFMGRPLARKGDAALCDLRGETDHRDAAGRAKVARIRVANVYDLTIQSTLAAVGHLFAERVPGGCYTPSRLRGADFVARLPGSGALTITDADADAR